MNRPKVAVIMPCYNPGKFISKTIESVLAQNYINYQLIAGNDGSTDNTDDILQNYAHRITVVKHSDNGNHGQAATYNLCLKHVNSEYIAFIDNDDLWHPDKLKKQVDILDNYPEFGMVYTNGDIIDEKDKKQYSFLGSNHRERNETGDILLDCYIRTPSTVMVRSHVLQKAGEFVEGIGTDHDMLIRIKELTKFYYIDEKLFSYRIHNKQWSQTSTEEMWRKGFCILSRALDRYPYPYYIRKKRLAVLHYRLAELGIKTRKPGLALHLLMACYYDPFRALKIVCNTK